MKSTAVPKLNGIKVLVTRPEHQAQGLCQAIESNGGTPLLFPVIEIEDPADKKPLRQLIGQLDSFDILIFVSANAVERGMAAIEEDNGLPQKITVAAVGKSTAERLTERGVKDVLVPAERFDSEGLLSLAEMGKVKGKKIAIFRGEGGRETLAETLKKRGATVEYGECYRRVKPTADKKPIPQADIAVVTSSEGISNLVELAGADNRTWLEQLPMVVMSERNRQHATQLGLKGTILVAEQASDEGLIEAVGQWAEQQKKDKTGKKPMSEKKTDKQQKQPVAKAEKPATPTAPAKGEEKPSKPTPPATAKPKSSSAALPITILFVAVAGLAGGGYTVWQKQQTEQQQMQAAWQSQVSQLHEQIENLKRQQQVDKREQHLSDKQIAKVVEDNQALWTSLRNLQSRTGSDPRPWQYAEAEYLLRIANHQLQLQHDTETATAALKTADGTLAAIAEPALQPVRTQLAKELLALGSYATPDIGGISAKLITLSEQVTELPMQGGYQELQRPSFETEVSTTEEGWRGALEKTWQELKSLVVITRNDKPITPLMPPEQIAYLHHNIQLQLESARMAAMKGEAEIWSNSLNLARNWLYDFYDTEMPSVKSALALLDELKKVDIAPALPDISKSLRMLQKKREELNYKLTTPAKSNSTPAEPKQ